MRFWTFGQRQINKLKLQLVQAGKKVEEADDKAQASVALARTRSELVANIQALAGELESSRDECARLRTEVEAKDLENTVLTGHLTNALAAAESREEVERCARELKEAALKTATIASMTAPEMSVAKDAMKKNQALQHELTLMAKRRDDLKEEIASKQRMLEYLANNSWLLQQSQQQQQSSVQQEAAVSQQQQHHSPASLFASSLFPIVTEPTTTTTNNNNASTKTSVLNNNNIQTLAAVAIASSATNAMTKLQDQISQNEQKLAEKEQEIFALRRQLTASNEVQDDGATTTNEVQNNQPETNFITQLRQDATITILRNQLKSSQRKIAQQELFIQTSLNTISDVSLLVQNLMKLLDSILSTHSLFAVKTHNNKTVGEDSSNNAAASSSSEPHAATSAGAADSQLTSEERAVITRVLSVLEDHKSLVDERLSLIETFKQIGETSQALASCSTLEKRIEELAESKKHVSDLMKKLETIQKDNAEQSSWYGVVETAVDELKKQGESLEKQNVSAWSLFSEMALQKLDLGLKEHTANTKPQPPSFVTAAITTQQDAAVVDAAKQALQKGNESLKS